MTWCFALGPYLWLPMSAKVGSPREPRGSCQPSLVIRGLADTRQNNRTGRPDEFRSPRTWRHAHMAEKFAEIKQIPPGRFVKPCNILRCRSVSEEASRGREVSAWRASPRPTPSAHSLFYQPLSCGKGCEIWRESEEGSQQGDLNALPSVVTRGYMYTLHCINK